MKERLLKNGNNFDTFMEAIGKHYIEAQLWTDKYITKEYLIKKVADNVERIYKRIGRSIIFFAGRERKWSIYLKQSI